MRTRVLATAALTVLLPALALAWGWGPPPPIETVTVDMDGAGRLLTLGPYTATDYSGGVSDPVNLFFLDQDPREIRQALLALDAARGAPWTSLPFAGCVWADAMGSEQVAWAEPEGWVGGGVQLVCVNPGAPLGDPLRVHVRLYPQRHVTVGAAHLDFLVPHTAQHQALSWDLAREFVTSEMARTGLLTAVPSEVAVQTPGTFRAVPRPLYDPLFHDPDGLRLLIALGLAPAPSPDPPEPPPPGDVPIPTSGTAKVISAHIVLDPGWTVTRSAVDVTYSIVIPKPFCAESPSDLVYLAGPVHLSLVVETSPWGTYKRVQRIRGDLTVTPVVPDGEGGYTPTGLPVPAVVYENHRAVLDDWHGQLVEEGSQTLLSDPRQSLSWKLLGGDYDSYHVRESCGDDGSCR